MWNNSFSFTGSAPKKNNNEKKEKEKNEKISRIESKMSEINDDTNEIKQNTKLCTKDINLEFDILINSINNRRNELINQLNQHNSNQMTECNNQISKLNDILKQIQSNDNNNNSQLINAKIHETVSQRQQRLHFVSAMNKTQLISFINEFGKLTYPLDPPLLLHLKNNSKDFIIQIKWKLTQNNNKNNNNEQLQAKANAIIIAEKVKIYFKKMEKNNKSESIIFTKNDIDSNWDYKIVENDDDDDDVNDRYNTSMIEVPSDGHYAIAMRYLCKSLQIWSEMSDIKHIWIDNIRYEMPAFDVFDKEYVSMQLAVMSGGKQKGKHARMISCGHGFESGIHEWRILCNNYDHGMSGNSSHAIGVFTNNQIAVKGSNWVNHKESGYCYYWNSHRMFVYSSLNGDYLKQLNVNESWKNNDIISIILNCKNWTIDFYKNGIQINKQIIKIEKNQIYFPFVVFRSHDDQYTVIPDLKTD